jgi:hypothetical protein
MTFVVCHLDDTVLSRDIQIQGYHDNILRKDRNCFGGGVLVYISETLKVNIFTKFLENKFITNNRRHLNYVD